MSSVRGLAKVVCESIYPERGKPMAHDAHPPHFLIDGPENAPLTLALAHGAGAPMDAPFMTAMAAGLAGHGLRVVRFEFPYMAARRRDGRKRPPDPQARLIETWRAVISALGPERLVIGGKSMGGRMASLVAGEAGVRGLVCLSYPFHPPGKPERLRTAHLAGISTPTLIVQGTRDPFGTPGEVAGYDLAPCIRLAWIEDGNHDLVPRKASGRTREQNWQAAAAAVAGFVQDLLSWRHDEPPQRPRRVRRRPADAAGAGAGARPEGSEEEPAEEMARNRSEPCRRPK